MHFPSVSGIGPVKIRDLAKIEAKMYTDATLTSELVTPERKHLKPLKFSKPLWNLTCQKKGLSKNRGENVHGYYTCLGVR
jgi:hypothetical protein